ncbi:DUF445 domain-containing protein [Bacillus fonticola]|uniref:DUF445 domain-containing protein n=1 Tax=Bacillus fonticola TaxID=2728853 RepID=UPI001475B729|nr:DUF445 family protein [Bacillus fonticola]
MGALSVLILVVVGAFIGGMTNFIAIKMLFRPYTEWRIGSWRVPFTPGLIPKRHGELAVQLGKTVVEHLVTKDQIEQKIKSEEFQTGIKEWAQSEATDFFTQQSTWKEWVDEHLGDGSVARWEQTVHKEAESIVFTWVDNHKESTVGELLPESIVEYLNAVPGQLATEILSRTEDYFQSEEGKWRLQKMLDNFLEERGMLGGMLQMVLGNVNLIDRIQPELIRFLQHDGTKTLTVRLLTKEWDKWKGSSLEEMQQKISFDQEQVQKLLQTFLPIQKALDTPIEKIPEEWRHSFLHRTIPTLVTQFTTALVRNLDGILQRLQIEQLVTDQVASFSLPRLEELIVSIAKKELKMITYLGALLGGIIALVQAGILTILPL